MDVAEPLEFTLPIVSAAVAVVPLVALTAAYRRTRSPRVLLATFAFATMVVNGVVLFAIEVRAGDAGKTPEWVEFASDIIVVVLFALSFLWPRREPDEA